MATKRICSIPECGKPHNSKGFCVKHYKRLCRYGDALGGSTEKGDPLKFYNDIVLKYDGEECLTWPYALNRDGYGAMTIDGKTSAVSRFLCEDFNGKAPSSKHVAAHECGNGHLECVSKRHISWKTQAENQADRILHGTHSRGERNSNSKLTEQQVKEILSLEGKETRRVIADRYGVTPAAIYCIHARLNWRWVTTSTPEKRQLCYEMKLGWRMNDHSGG